MIELNLNSFAVLIVYVSVCIQFHLFEAHGTNIHIEESAKILYFNLNLKKNQLKKTQDFFLLNRK